jgi:hypothetical protein
MTTPTTVKGQYFDVAVDVTSLNLANGVTGFVYLCGLNTKNLTHQINTNDEAIPDCDRPGDVAWRVLNATSQQKDMAGTGVHNLANSSLIRAIYGKSLPYRFIEAQPGTTTNDKDMLGYWEGQYMFTNWQEGANDGTNVTSQFTFASDGPVLWVDMTSLDTLTVSPATGAINVEYTGTISHRTPGSTITATSTGATPVITGNVVKATWTTAGAKTLTFVETLAGATGSPKTTATTVTVS